MVVKMSKIKTSVRLSRKAHDCAKREAKRQRRSISAQLEIYLEDLFGNGEIRIPEPIPSVGAKP